MFRIDATFEDTRMIAEPVNECDHSQGWNVSLVDGFTGKKMGPLHATGEQLQAILACLIHPDGEGYSPEQYDTACDWNAKNNVPYEFCTVP